jgi:uncharacterized membrane protein YphA (DoxX/SURF4 family)
LSVIAPRSSSPNSIATSVVAVLLCLAFLAAGLAKLTSQPMMQQEFASFGYPLWFMFVTGTIEIVSAVLVVIPRTSRLGAALLMCVMAGALFSHLTHGQIAMIGVPLVLLVLAITAFQLRGGFATPILSARTAASTAG